MWYWLLLGFCLGAVFVEVLGGCGSSHDQRIAVSALRDTESDRVVICFEPAGGEVDMWDCRVMTPTEGEIDR